MFQEVFNELDNDFITCWSKYLLTKDSSIIMKELEALAELGQINAVQNWYLFNDIGINSKIDNIVKDYKDDDYNQLFAKARFFLKDEEQANEYDSVAQFVDEYRYANATRQLTDRAKESRKKLAKISFIKYYSESKKLGFNIGHANNNYVILQNANEIYNEFGNIVPMEYNQDSIFYNVRKGNKKICAGLLAQCKHYEKLGNDINDNPILYFSLAKAILMSNKTRKFKRKALSILDTLSQRKYSQTLVEEVNKNKR